jgi:hypothetical protein
MSEREREGERGEESRVEKGAMLRSRQADSSRSSGDRDAPIT